LTWRRARSLRIGSCLTLVLASACSLYDEELLNTSSRQTIGDAATVDTSFPIDPPIAPGDDAGAALDHSAPLADARMDVDAGAPGDDALLDRVVADNTVADAGSPDMRAPDVDPPRTDAEAGAPDASGPPDVGTPGTDATKDPDVIDVKTTVDAEAGTREAGCVGTTMHDEDGDGVVDSCDNCPSVANANQADTGEQNAGGMADGVGDACDPRPAAGGDSILLFDPFTSGQISSDWQVNGGTWQAGTETIAETATGNAQELDRVSFANISDYLVETQVTLDALPTSDSRATLVSRMTTSSHNGWGCAVMQNVLIFSQIANGEAGESSPPSVSIPAPTVGSRYRIQTGGYGTNLYCRLPDSGYEVPRTSSTYPSGVPGLRSYAAATTFEYLLVYRLGGALP
jgi:hypothetical protein